MNDILLAIIYGFIALASLACIFRLIIGPTLQDRVVAFDLLAAILIVTFMVLGIQYDQGTYLSVAVSIAIISFLATVVISSHLLSEGGHK
jgi:multicomponent Na+:H+ antiporter subunit F